MSARPAESGGWTGSRRELTDLRPAHGGAMVGRDEGRAVFVRGALPGERVLVEVTEDRHRSYCHAVVVEVVEPSAHRIDPVCAAAAAGAGCCDLSFATDDHARDIKATVLREQLERLGGWSADALRAAGVDAVGVASLGAPTHWRTRVRMPVDAAGVVGVHAPASDAVVTGARCAQPIVGLLDGLDAHSWTPGAEVVAVAGDDGVMHLTELVMSPATPARGRSGRGRDDRRGRAQRARAGRSVTRETVVAGSDTAVHRVGGRTWLLPVTGFWQAHRSAPTRYGELVAEMAARHAPTATSAWDLYGGVGVFAGALCDAIDTLTSVVVVEADAAATAAARATYADDDRVAVYRGPVDAALANLPAPDVVVADPPRSGAGRSVVEGICAAAPALVVHVGCDAATFARDLGTYRELGYRPVELVGLDAFPLTHHVEAIAALVPDPTLGSGRSDEPLP
ncbi:TRAM domain-containing protein [Williamsia herbipolensis]|uniref:TRAM domain-containing protein n=1 Tax=Williamsia herbipolensis TaxID=1603258 RepID=A0AAU4K3E1_9NOCA|nr:TRAM domain-containing protein [Williamsia herbipolensis]